MRVLGIKRKAMAVANTATAILMVNADMRDLTLFTTGTVTVAYTFDSAEAIEANTATWTPQAVSANAFKAAEFTPVAWRVTGGAGGGSMVACWKH